MYHVKHQKCHVSQYVINIAHILARFFGCSGRAQLCTWVRPPVETVFHPVQQHQALVVQAGVGHPGAAPIHHLGRRFRTFHHSLCLDYKTLHQGC